jgi:hypothetical protein
MDIKELNKQLSNGVLPDVLNYGIEQKPLDICELKYNAFYRSYEFVEHKIKDILISSRVFVINLNPRITLMKKALIKGITGQSIGIKN